MKPASFSQKRIFVPKKRLLAEYNVIEKSLDISGKSVTNLIFRIFQEDDNKITIEDKLAISWVSRN